MHKVLRIAIDAVAVGAFAAIGRRSHDHGVDLLGVAQTAAPFWLGTAAGWGICALGPKRTALGEGLTILVSTVVIGHLVRALFGPGTAVSFIIVSLIALAVLLLGWRGIAWLLTRRSAA